MEPTNPRRLRHRPALRTRRWIAIISTSAFFGIATFIGVSTRVNTQAAARGSQPGQVIANPPQREHSHHDDHDDHDDHDASYRSTQNTSTTWAARPATVHVTVTTRAKSHGS